MNIAEDLKYSEDHEWVRVDGDIAYVGISDYAQNSLGDIVFVELPQIDTQLDAKDVLGVVESIKAASDIYTPIAGTVVKVNETLENAPETINSTPYESWLAALKFSDMSEIDNLMDADAYRAFCEAEQE
jgi:glycine cleavage system H protein